MGVVTQTLSLTRSREPRQDSRALLSHNSEPTMRTALCISRLYNRRQDRGDVPLLKGADFHRTQETVQMTILVVDDQR